MIMKIMVHRQSSKNPCLKNNDSNDKLQNFLVYSEVYCSKRMGRSQLVQKVQIRLGFILISNNLSKKKIILKHKDDLI